LANFRASATPPAGVLELERDPLGEPLGCSLFFRDSADPPGEKSDADILCRLEYQTPIGFYLLQRARH
jgi:hypothetical protein